MDFFHIKEEAANLQEEAKHAANAKLRYYKLWFFRLLVRLLSDLSQSLVLGAVALLAVLFLAFSAAFALGAYWHNVALGFLAVGLLFVVVVFVLYLWGGKNLQKLWLKKLSEIYFKE